MSNTAPAKDPYVMVLTGRISYPNLFQPRKKTAKDANKAPSWGVSIILDKKADADQIKKIKEVIKLVASDKWKEKNVLVKGQTDNLINAKNPNAPTVMLAGIALRDGIEKMGTDGYGRDVMFVSSNRSSAPTVCKSEGGALVKIGPEDPKAPYAGCYGKVSVRFWAQESQDNGNRVNCETRVVIFHKHGEPFGKGAVDAEADFAGVNLDEEDESTPAAKSDTDLDIDDMG